VSGRQEDEDTAQLVTRVTQFIHQQMHIY